MHGPSHPVRHWRCLRIAFHLHSAVSPRFSGYLSSGFLIFVLLLSFNRVHSRRSRQWPRPDNRGLSPPPLRRRRRYGNTSARTTSRGWKKSKRKPLEETTEKCMQKNGLQLNCALWSSPRNCITSCRQRFLPLGITVSSGNYKACVLSR